MVITHPARADKRKVHPGCIPVSAKTSFNPEPTATAATVAVGSGLNEPSPSGPVRGNGKARLSCSLLLRQFPGIMEFVSYFLAQEILTWPLPLLVHKAIVGKQRRTNPPRGRSPTPFAPYVAACLWCRARLARSEKKDGILPDPFSCLG